MSSKIYIEAAVSYEEKGQWVYLIANVLTLGAYLLIVSGQAGRTPLTDIDYVPTLLWTIGIAIALSIGGRVLVEIVSRNERYKADIRDRDIGRFGEYVGGILLGVAMLVPFGLALAEADHFWIANAIYLAFALSAFVGTTVKLVAYRRGL
jgi:drug/metabolite transporter (DMT)-like permease